MLLNWNGFEMALALEVISLPTTSRAWTSIVQMVIIFWRSPLVSSPMSKVMRLFNWVTCGKPHALSIYRRPVQKSPNEEPCKWRDQPAFWNSPWLHSHSPPPVWQRQSLPLWSTRSEWWLMQSIHKCIMIENNQSFYLMILHVDIRSKEIRTTGFFAYTCYSVLRVC